MLMQARRRGAAETRGHLHVRFKEGDHHDQQMRIDAKKDGMGMGGVQGLLAERPWSHRKQDGESAQVRPARRRIDAEHRHAIGQGSVVIDGYSELQFDSYGDMVEGVESLHGEGANDVPMFANPHCQILVLAKREVIRIPEYLRGRKLIKRVSFLGRADGVTSEQFVKEWWNVHDRLVQTVPGCVGYNQDLVIDRIDGGVSVPYEELPVEGVVEMWFETKGTVRRVLRFPRIRARLCAQLGVHRGDQHLPDRNLSGCLAVCIGACDLPSKKLRFSKEEAREKGSTI